MTYRPVDFIIIGAMRCGTTSLHYDLARHPEISMSRKKETDFFVRDCSKEIYQAQFNASKRLWGETSPNYSKFEIFPDVPKRIFKHSPRAKLIYLVRDPSDRVSSQYRHAVALGRIPKTDSLSLHSPQIKHMIETSRYFSQLSKFRERFTKEAILIVDFDHYARNRLAVLDRITDFIGASRYKWREEFSPENASLALMKYPKMMGNLRQNFVLNKLYHALPHSWQSRAKNMMSHQKYCIQSESNLHICRNEILDKLRDDIVAFRDEYSFDVSSWMIGAEDV